MKQKSSVNHIKPILFLYNGNINDIGNEVTEWVNSIIIMLFTHSVTSLPISWDITYIQECFSMIICNYSLENFPRVTTMFSLIIIYTFIIT